jgi:hypothetical protein
MSHINENPVENEVDLMARIASVFANIKKYVMYISSRTQRTLCVADSVTIKSQAVTSTALVNYSKILPLKYTKINRFKKYIYNDTNKFKMIYMLVYFKYLMLRVMRNSCST